ncbi:hypothetical protein BDA96_09G028900 [Sorghum bicolor]|uniref:Uncharacterized protein n=1 Tax=Sorghum bicolor TaxID=4558 RepID=A0A921U3C8_SORBI|nr:hypothetical protein BDA96_09G028900 [Sorghum bicolor]
MRCPNDSCLWMSTTCMPMPMRCVLDHSGISWPPDDDFRLVTTPWMSKRWCPSRHEEKEMLSFASPCDCLVERCYLVVSIVRYRPDTWYVFSGPQFCHGCHLV